MVVMFVCPLFPRCIFYVCVYNLLNYQKLLLAEVTAETQRIAQESQDFVLSSKNSLHVILCTQVMEPKISTLF